MTHRILLPGIYQKRDFINILNLSLEIVHRSFSIFFGGSHEPTLTRFYNVEKSFHQCLIVSDYYHLHEYEVILLRIGKRRDIYRPIKLLNRNTVSQHM